MKFEELTKRIVDEGLDEYAFIKFGTLYGPEYSVCIARNEDGTFSIRYYGERGSVDRELLNIPEEEACETIYKYANAKKAFELAYQEKKNSGQGMTM